MRLVQYSIIILSCVLLLLTSNLVCAQAKKDENYYKAKGYQVFPAYSLAIKVPVTLKDVSLQSKDNSDLNYAGMADENSKEKRAFYQVIINKLPEGYSALSTSEKAAYNEKLYASMPPGKQKVVFGVEKLTAFVMPFTKNGMTGKGIVIIRNGYNYGFTIITNYQFTERFNSLTNSIEFISK